MTDDAAPAVKSTAMPASQFTALNQDDKIKYVIEYGSQMMTTLFEYKSVIPSLVQVKGDDPNKKELYRQNLDILEPQIQKMRDLATFNDQMAAGIVAFSQQLLSAAGGDPTAAAPAPAPAEAKLESLVKGLDVALSLDYLKTWQAGLNNDFSMYRRAIQHVKKDYNLSEDEALRHFLINPNNINKGLKTALQGQSKGFERILYHVIKYCVDKFEKDHDQGQQYLRVAVFCVFLIDNLLNDGGKLATAKKVFKVGKVDKVFKGNQRVALYKQLPFNVANYLKGCPNWNEAAENDGKGGCFG